MSEEFENEGIPPVVAARKQEPGRAVQVTAPGVRSAQELPEGATLSTGELVGGRFVIVRYLGSSGGGVSYLSEDTSLGGEVVIKVLAMDEPDNQVFNQMAESVRLASTIEHRNLTKIIGMGRVEDGRAFVAMQFVRGATLSSIISKRRKEGTGLSVRDTFTILAHVCNALDEVHKLMHHGVLTPYNIYIDQRGTVHVGNLAFGKIAADYLIKQNRGPYIDSVYVAPEAADAGLVSDAADIYSLGMIAAEMLSANGLPNDRDEAKAEAIMMLSSYPSVLSRLISTCIGEDLTARPRSARAFRERFLKALTEMGIDPSEASGDGDLVLEPAVSDSRPEEENLFDIPELSGSVNISAGDSSTDRYLVQKGGLDYGPFTAEQVLAQLHKDEIDEFTSVLDRVTQHRIPLGEMDEFKAKVREYIPVREERRRKEAEARADLERKVKKTGYAGIAVGIAVGLFFLVSQIVYLVTRPDPVSFPIQEAFAEMDYKFLPPPKEFTAVSVDKDLLESIFNPEASEEEIAKQIKKRRKKRRGKRPQSAGGDKGDGAYEATMGQGGRQTALTDDEVNDVILANFGGLRSCILKELKRNSGFRGVEIQFFIRPTGTTGGVKIQGGQGAVADCLTSRFRSMKFPQSGALGNKGVSYPLRVQ